MDSTVKNSVVPSGAPFEACLALAAALAGRPVSVASLTAGLPVEAGALEAGARPRAAERAGLELLALPAGTDLHRLRHEEADCGESGPLLLALPAQGFGLVEGWAAPGGDARLRVPAAGGKTLDESLGEAALARLVAGGGALLRPCYLPRVPETDLAPPSQRYAWLRRAVAADWRSYAQAAGLTLVVNLLAILSSFYTLQVYDRVVPNQAFATLWALSVGVALAYLFDFAARMVRSYGIDLAGKRLDLEVSGRLFSQVMGLKMAHRPASAGVFANHLREFETIRDFFTSLTLVAMFDLPFALLFVVTIAFIGGWVALAPLLAMPLLIGISLALQKPLDAAVRASMQASAQKHGMLIESLEGCESLKMSAAEGTFQKVWERASLEVALSSMRAKTISTFGVSLIGLAQSLVSLGLVVVGVYLIADRRLSMGGLIACTILSGRAIAPMAQIASLLTRLQQTRIAMETLDGIFAKPVERPAGKAFLLRPVLGGEVEFRNVSFAYPGAPGAALRNVSFCIAAGERVAIIGRSGSGKSTVARLVIGLYEPADGAVLVGGADTRQLDPHQLRRSISAVGQDPFLFSGTVRENIAYGDDFPDDVKVVRAAQAAGVDDFVRVHPLGYDMPVGERGRFLSGGQRQAVCLARALISGGTVLLLDEPTNSLDHAAEAALRERLRHSERTETLLLITHRMPLLDLVDRVIVLHDGRVAMDGPKQAVLEALQKGVGQ